MRRKLWAIAGVVVLAAVVAGGRWAWLRRPAGVFSLPPIDVPEPECAFTVQLDRESDSGQLVQFGDLRCPGEPDPEPVMHVGPRWFRLPSTSAESRYGIVRRSENNRAWIVASDADFFRSDDGGETFFLLHLPSWEDASDPREPTMSGEHLEHLRFEYTEHPSRLRRLKMAFEDTRPTTLRERWLVVSGAWDEVSIYVAGFRVLRFESDDGGRTWTKHASP